MTIWKKKNLNLKSRVAKHQNCENVLDLMSWSSSQTTGWCTDQWEAVGGLPSSPPTRAVTSPTSPAAPALGWTV